MSRDDGFERADIDTGLLGDPKVVALAKRLRDPFQVAAHMTAYVGVVLGSWRGGGRISLEEAMPGWWLDDAGPIAANLIAVGLLDADGHVPLPTFERWFRPAWDRREVARAKGRKGGLVKPSDKLSLSPAQPGVKPSYTPAQPDRQTDNPTLTPEGRTGSSDVAEPVFAHLEARGVLVDRTNGHASSLREDVMRVGHLAVMTVLAEMPELVDARQAAFAVRNRVAPIPKASRHREQRTVGNTVDRDPTLRDIRAAILARDALAGMEPEEIVRPTTDDPAASL